MTGKNKEVLINIRLKPETREEFRISAELRGATMSGLLHQFIVRTIREEKERDPKAFANLQGSSQTEEIHLADKHFNSDAHPVQNELHKKFLRGKKEESQTSATPPPTVINKGAAKGTQREKPGEEKSDK
jgi:hypothetical protein